MKSRGNATDFPHYKQNHPHTCGPACLCMIADWITREPQSEIVWARTSHTKRPVKFQKHATELKGIAQALDEMTNIDEYEITSGKVVNKSGLRFNSNTIYLALLDSYNLDGKNEGHFILLIGRLPLGKKLDQIIIADPSEDELYVEPWKAIQAKLQTGTEGSKEPKNIIRISKKPSK